MNKIECEFCKSELSNKYTLNFHKKNNKKCLEIQKKSSGDIKCSLKQCEFCNKSFNSSNLKTHLLTCKIKIKSQTEEQTQTYEKINLELEKKNYDKDIQILELEKTILNQTKKLLEQETKISELQETGKINLENENKISILEKINLEKDIKISNLETELQTYKNIYEKRSSSYY